MKFEKVKLKDLKHADYNPRKDLKPSDSEYQKIKKSIEEFGYVDPIIVNADNTIIGGHQRAKVLVDLGFKEIDIVRVDIDKTKEKALNIALNKISGEWNFEQLEVVLADLKMDDYDIELTGFDLDEVEDILGIEKEVEEDDFEVELPDEPKSKLGDIWQLGRHRLMCGDSTSINDVEKLMNGNKADMVFTDPPYGVSYTGGVIHGNEINIHHKREMLQNDDVDIYSDFIPLLNNVIDDGAIYIFYATCNSYELLKPLHDNNIELNSIIVWNKINTGYADMNSNYKNKYEPCVYCKRKGHKLNFVGATNECTVWDIEKDRDNKLHPTQKPIAVPSRAIKNSSIKDNIVLDLFGGSGSTLIACEQLNRKCYMMELDPKYVDVIIDRWEQLTGNKAELIEGDRE